MAVPMDMRQYPLEVTRALSRRRRYRLAIPGQKFVFDRQGEKLGACAGRITPCLWKPQNWRLVRFPG
jgi:hypothetical protein